MDFRICKLVMELAKPSDLYCTLEGRESYKEALLKQPTHTECIFNQLPKSRGRQSSVRTRVKCSIAGRCARCLDRDHKVADG